jgi:hypothetical protein
MINMAASPKTAPSVAPRVVSTFDFGWPVPSTPVLVDDEVGAEEGMEEEGARVEEAAADDDDDDEVGALSGTCSLTKKLVEFIHVFVA